MGLAGNRLLVMDRLARKARAGTVSEKTKASVTVLEFVSQCVDLKPTESGAIGLCPFHDDHQPSLGVNDEGNYWHVLSSFRPY